MMTQNSSNVHMTILTTQASTELEQQTTEELAIADPVTEAVIAELLKKDEINDEDSQQDDGERSS